MASEEPRAQRRNRTTPGSSHVGPNRELKVDRKVTRYRQLAQWKGVISSTGRSTV